MRPWFQPINEFAQPGRGRSWAIVILVIACLASSAHAQQRLIHNAAAQIRCVGIPADASGMARTRELRLSVIPFLPPFGAHVIVGRAVAFRVGACGCLYDPHVSRIRGGGVSAGIGFGSPFSGSLSSEIRSFRGDEFDRFTSRRHRQMSVKVVAAAGWTPLLKVKSIGPSWGDPWPGKVEASRQVFHGRFASVNIEASFKTLRPRIR